MLNKSVYEGFSYLTLKILVWNVMDDDEPEEQSLCSGSLCITLSYKKHKLLRNCKPDTYWLHKAYQWMYDDKFFAIVLGFFNKPSPNGTTLYK